MIVMNKQKGSVSLFVVVFAALLITIVTVSFIRIMVHDQEQATTADLSQSAYDSAQAGVEDAKRALVRYQDICSNSTTECVAVQQKINSSVCNDAVKTLEDIPKTDGEIKVQQLNSANALDQAYTCVKINLNTPDYLGKMAVDDSKIIPLIGDEPFDTIKIEWFNSSDLGAKNDVDLPSSINSLSLPKKSEWSQYTPPIIRAQIIQFGSSFSLSDFDDSEDSEGTNASTVFLQPAAQGLSGSLTEISFPDFRRVSSSPMLVSCNKTVDQGTYSCSMQLKIPKTIGGVERSTLFLRLSAIYNSANYKISLSNSSKPINFKAVQPEIDSTGRANNLFRRVKTRVELTDTNYPYPDAAVDITGSFCKDFLVTDDDLDYNAGMCSQ